MLSDPRFALSGFSRHVDAESSVLGTGRGEYFNRHRAGLSLDTGWL